MNPKYQQAIALAAAAMLGAEQHILAAEGILPEGSALRHGDIALANETMFNEAFFSQPQTNYGVGWMDRAPLRQEIDFLFPPCQVTRRFDYAEATNAEEFLADTNDEDIREIGASFKTVKAYTEKKTHAETTNKGLTILIDLDRVAEKQNWRQNYTRRLIDRLIRAELRRGLTKLSAAAVNNAKTWDVTAGKDPDMDIIQDRGTGADISGLHFNRLYFGETSWTKRLLSFRAQNNAGGFASAALSEQELAAFIGVDRIFRSGSRYQSTANAKAQFGGNKVIGFFGLDGLSETDPSNTKRFWTPCKGGTMIRVYEQEVSEKIYKITVEHYSDVVITSTLGIRQLTIS